MVRTNFPDSAAPPQAKAPRSLRDSLLRSKAQIEAGEVVPLDAILDELRANADRLDAATEDHEPPTR